RGLAALALLIEHGRRRWAHDDSRPLIEGPEARVHVPRRRQRVTSHGWLRISPRSLERATVGRRGWHVWPASRRPRPRLLGEPGAWSWRSSERCEPAPTAARWVA